jgi:hypothetical protein
MDVLTILLFLGYGIGLGSLATLWSKESEDIVEVLAMRLGIGIALFAIIGAILNLLGITIVWWIFGLLAAIGLGLSLYKKGFKKSKISVIHILLLIIVVGATYMYVAGSMAYPYLENDDPWAHAEGAKYVAQAGSLNDVPGFDFNYLDPYPPAYDLLMGVLHQTSDSLYWVLKFFNGLIIALSLLWFFFFSRRFMGSGQKALFATFCLATLPSFFTHFIWAHTLAVAFFFPSMYCLLKIDQDRNWILPASISIAGILLSQPSQGLKMGIMLAMFVATICIYRREVLKVHIGALVGGVLLSLPWWLPKGLIFFNDKVGVYARKSGMAEVPTSFIQKIITLIPPGAGTATRAYTFNDFFYAVSAGPINVLPGWGVIISLLLVVGLAGILLSYKKFLDKKHEWIGVTAVWFTFTFIFVNSVTFNLPIGLIAFRVWLLLAIPVVLLATHGLWMLLASFSLPDITKIGIIVLVAVGIGATAGLAKYQHNGSEWPPGVAWIVDGQMSGEEIGGFLWLKDNLEPGTKVFTYSKDDSRIIGLDMDSCFWCEDVIDFREHIVEKSPEELDSFLKRNQYEYLIVSRMSKKYLSKKFSPEEAAVALNSTINFAVATYEPIAVTKDVQIFKIR